MKANKKLIISLIILFLIVVLGCVSFVIVRNAQIASENKKPVFKISKIMLYSSGGMVDNSQNGLLQDLDISQFTDIAVYIDNKSRVQDLTPQNTVKELSICNIKLDANSDVGSKFVNYKNPLSYGKFANLQYNDKDITFKGVTTNEENNNSDYNTPVFFADCSNPISLGYLNSGILKNYNMPEDDNYGTSLSAKTAVFDGSILKKAGIKIEDLKCNLSFTIKITNYLGEQYTCDIVLNNIVGDDSLYNGYYTKEYTPQSSLYDFVQI